MLLFTSLTLSITGWAGALASPVLVVLLTSPLSGSDFCRDSDGVLRKADSHVVRLSSGAPTTTTKGKKSNSGIGSHDNTRVVTYEEDGVPSGGGCEDAGGAPVESDWDAELLESGAGDTSAGLASDAWSAGALATSASGCTQKCPRSTNLHICPYLTSNFCVLWHNKYRLLQLNSRYADVLLLVESAVSMATGDTLRCCDSGAVLGSNDEKALKFAQPCNPSVPTHFDVAFLRTRGQQPLTRKTHTRARARIHTSSWLLETGDSSTFVVA